jgi:glycosyltransferase involved in cell wall biosynthesis
MTSAPDPPPRRESRPLRLAYLVSHPIQYQAPLLRRIAQEPDIDLTVLFGSDFSVRGYTDAGFGVKVKWDVPLLDGYKHEFLPGLRDTGNATFASPINYGILNRLRGRNALPPFDVLWVHGYATVNAIHGILAANALGIPVLLRAESWLGDRTRTSARLAIKRSLFQALKPMIAAVLPIGTLNAQYWRHYFGDDVPQFPMPYAVDNAYFAERARQAQSRRAALQSELNLSPDRPVILFASKLQPRKHCDHLIAAFAQLIAANPTSPHPYLVIVGDGEERAALERRAEHQAAGLPATTGLDAIRFCGFRNQSELPRFFDLATVFVLPSRHEPWGLIVNEVMNAARPAIVTSDVGCAPDLIADGISGFLYPAGDIDALALALRRTLAPGVAEAMGRHAFDRIQTWSFEQDIQGLRDALAHVAPGFLA